MTDKFLSDLNGFSDILNFSNDCVTFFGSARLDANSQETKRGRVCYR